MKQPLSIILASLLIFASFPLPSAQSVTVSAAAFNGARPGELLVRKIGEQYAVKHTYASNEEAAWHYARFLADPEVVSVQPNFVYQASATTNDPLLSSQDYLAAINIEPAWEIQPNAKDVVVAVIDSGVDLSHPDLAENIWVNPGEVLNGKDDDQNGYIDDLHGWDFLAEQPDPSPKYPVGFPENAIGVQHGTVVAGIIAAQGDNGIGIAGVAQKVQLMPLRVLNELGTGTSETVTRAFQYAMAQEVDIINLSLVGTDYDPLLVELLDEAYKKGILVVAAAGNSGANLNATGTYPVCYTHLGAATVIGVGSIELDFSRPDFSNYGSDCVDIVAPGVDIFSTRHVGPRFQSKDQYKALFSGTSFSAPQVTGVLALLKQIRPSLQADEALRILQQGAKPIGALHASGIGFDYALNAGGAVALAEQGREPVQEEETAEAVVSGFLAYPRSSFEGLPYLYQFPGPTAMTPIVFEAGDFHSGMQFVRQTSLSAIVHAKGEQIRKVYSYNFFTSQLSLILDLPIDDEQTVGSVAVGNVDGDPEDDLVVVSGQGQLPLLSIYDFKGTLKYRFRPFENNIVGGLSVALIDTNGDGIQEMAVVPERQTDGLVRIFEYTGLLHHEFVSYERFGGGATITSADINGDGQSELILGPGESGGPHIKIFHPDGQLVLEFFAGDVIDGGGAHVEFLDVNRDERKEFVVSYKTTHTPVFRMYSPEGAFEQEWGVLDGDYRGGVGFYPL